MKETAIIATTKVAEIIFFIAISLKDFIQTVIDSISLIRAILATLRTLTENTITLKIEAHDLRRRILHV